MELAVRPKLSQSSESSKPLKNPPVLDERKTTFRVTGIPGSYSREILHDQLIEGLGIDERSTLKIHSFASDIDDDTTSEPKTATVSFRDVPEQLGYTGRKRSEDWSYCLKSESLSRAGGSALYLDTSFDGFTPLSPVEGDGEHEVDCVVIPGWGGHAFGSFKERGGSFMWLRDEITSLFPRLRVWLYGYSSSLTDEISIESVDDWCHTFCDLLIDLRTKPRAAQQKRPLIFIVHSLGGWIFKQAMILLSQNRDTKANAIVRHTYGAMFFGVPSQGMNTEALATMVGQKPQRATIALLDEGKNYRLRTRLHQEFCEAFNFEHSRIIKFFETSLSETVKYDIERKQWLQNGDRVLLVSPDSATTGRSWDRREDEINLKGTHSTMVKFKPNDRIDYRKVKSKLRELIEEAEDAIKVRISSLAAKSGLGISKDSDPYKVPFSLKGLPLVANFIARDEEMADLRASLLPVPARKTQRKVFVLYGQGGSGKTQLAIEFARTSENDFSSTFWLNGESLESIRQSFASVARKLPKDQMPKQSENLCGGASEGVDEAVKNGLNWFIQAENKQWLLIYDNVDRDNSPESGDPLSFDVEDFFPEADHGSILITTRLRKLGQYGDGRNIRRMTKSQGLDILKSRIDRPIEGLERIVELVGSLPLALAHAGSFLQGTATSVDDYIRFYQETWSDLFDSKETARLKEYPRSILSTYTISYKHVQNVDMDAAMALKLFAYLDNSDLWYSLFTPLLDSQFIPTELVPGWFQNTFCKEFDFTRRMQILLEYSLIETRRDTSSYAIHPVIHNWCLHVGDGNDEMASLAIFMIGSACASILESPDLMSGKRLLIHSNFIFSWLKSPFWRFSDDATRKESLKMSLLKLESFLYHQGKPVEAVAIAQQILEDEEKVLGPDHISTLQTVSRLGTLYNHQGRLVEAEAMNWRALQGQGKMLGPYDRTTLITTANLAILRIRQGKLVEAEAMLQRVIQSHEKVLKPDNILIPVHMHSLGALYRDQGKFTEAEAMYRRALDGYQKLSVPDRTWTVRTLDHLGFLYLKQNKFSEAENMYLLALQNYDKTLESGHKSILGAMDGLGFIYSKQDKLVEAEAMYKRALEGYEKTLGPNDISTLNVIQNLGIIREKQDNLMEAEAMYQRALKGLENVLGPEHKATLASVYNLASLYQQQRRYEESLALFQRAESGYRTTLGPQFPWAITALHRLEEVQQLQMSEPVAKLLPE